MAHSYNVPSFVIDPADADTDPQQRIILQGKPDDPDLLAFALTTHYHARLRTNLRTGAIEYDMPVHGPMVQERTGWRPLDDVWRNQLRLSLLRNFSFGKIKDLRKKKKEHVYTAWNAKRLWLDQALEMLATDDQRDDVLDYFLSLSLENKWDGIPRIQNTLLDCFGTPFNEYTAWCAANLFVGTVLATLQPGQARRGIVTLVGPQYNGKTTFLRSLLPAHLSPYSCSISLHGDDKQRTEAMLGMALVELGELAGATRTESEQLKSWLTKDADYVRLSYRRDPVRIPRKTLITASINRGQELPRDPSGSTRWCIVECPENCNVERDITDEMRDQWWAEAVAVAQKEGPGGHNNLTAGYFHGGIPHRLLDQQAQANQPHEARNDGIHNALEQLDFEHNDFATTLELAIAIGYCEHDTKQLPRRDAIELAAELRLAGWEAGTERRDGKKIKGWILKIPRNLEPEGT